jgi:hypothetical protein
MAGDEVVAIGAPRWMRQPERVPGERGLPRREGDAHGSHASRNAASKSSAMIEIARKILLLTDL